MPVLLSGIRHLPCYLDRARQEALVEVIRAVVAEAPLYVPAMPGTGKPMSVRMTNCGPLGWVTDKERGYRYQPMHPATGRPWPDMPQQLLDIWNDVARYDKPPEACLVNFYSDDARMGLHQDKDEQDLKAPVVSLSLSFASAVSAAMTVRYLSSFRAVIWSCSAARGDCVSMASTAFTRRRRRS